MIGGGMNMTIEKVDQVDIIGIDNDTGYVSLWISDHLDWEDEEMHLRLLQDKINRYLSFCESGEIYEKYPEARGRKIEFSVYAKHDTPQICVDFFNRVSQILEEQGFSLKYQVTG